MNKIDSRHEQVTLELLSAIEQRSDVSQRHLAQQLGIALGLANSYLRRCAKKGYVKIREAPPNRYLYYLTPKGFAEKSRLTARFLSASLSFYRHAAEACSELFQSCDNRKWFRVILCGTSDLAEIAYMRSGETRVRVLGIYDPTAEGSEFMNLPVWGHWDQVEDADAFIVTGLEDPLHMYETVLEHAQGKERVLVPDVLGLQGAIKNR